MKKHTAQSGHILRQTPFMQEGLTSSHESQIISMSGIAQVKTQFGNNDDVIHDFWFAPRWTGSRFFE